MKKQALFFSLFVGLSLLCLAVMFMVKHPQSDNNNYYANPFAAKIERKQKAIREAELEEAGEQGQEAPSAMTPQASGFRESDIRKYKGNRYETY